MTALRSLRYVAAAAALAAGCAGAGPSVDAHRSETTAVAARPAAATTTTEPWDDVDESFYEENADPWPGEPSEGPGPFIDRATGRFWCVTTFGSSDACTEAEYFGVRYARDARTGEWILVNRWGLEAVCTMPDGSAARCGP